MEFDCYTGDCGSIPTHCDSLGKWHERTWAMPCEGNWVVSSRCWREIELNTVYNCENELLSLKQFNHHILIQTHTTVPKDVFKKQLDSFLRFVPDEPLSCQIFLSLGERLKQPQDWDSLSSSITSHRTPRVGWMTTLDIGWGEEVWGVHESKSSEYK